MRPTWPTSRPRAHVLHGPEHESSTFRFCTNFAVTGAGLEGPAFVAPLEAYR